MNLIENSVFFEMKEKNIKLVQLDFHISNTTNLKLLSFIQDISHYHDIELKPPSKALPQNINDSKYI